MCFFFFFKQKTAYEMRISDWSSDVCSSDLSEPARLPGRELPLRPGGSPMKTLVAAVFIAFASLSAAHAVEVPRGAASDPRVKFVDYEEAQVYRIVGTRSEEHTSELQSLMRISYAVFCLKKKNSL